MSSGAAGRVNQFLACAVPRDAVSNFVFRCDEAFRREDPRRRIWAESYSPEFEGRVSQFIFYPEVSQRSDNCIWHVSTDSVIAPWLTRNLERDLDKSGQGLAVYYHNVTPSEFIRPYDKVLAGRLDLAREQTAQLAPLTRVALANSSFSAQELVEWGFPTPHVENRLLFDDSARVPPPDEALLSRLIEERGRGPAILFVGRISPNKGQDSLIRALRLVRRAYPDAKLWLVGGTHLEAYTTVLEELADDLGVGGGIFAGSVAPSALSAFYAAADVFCCLSAHEGFGIPVLEGMRAGLPVIAYGATAVPETAGDGALLLDSREPEVVAEAIALIFEDDSAREGLVEVGAARIAGLEPTESAEARLCERLEIGR